MQINEQPKVFGFRDIDEDVLNGAYYEGDLELYMRDKQTDHANEKLRRRLARYCFKCGCKLRFSSHDFIHKSCARRHRNNLRADYDSDTGRRL